MSRTVSDERWDAYFDLRRNGLSQVSAAREVGIAPSTAERCEKGGPSSGRDAYLRAVKKGFGSKAKTSSQLRDPARKALADFAYFRRRYFGRISTPWQTEAAYKVLTLLESDRKEYVVINAPPGGGKSKLFAHDIPAWLICRNRAIRMIIGSLTERQAKLYVTELRDTFEQEVPLQAPDKELRAGRAVNAESTLLKDFGRFKTPTGRWSTSAFDVVQEGDHVLTSKEPTVSAFGQDGGSLGYRVDFVIWDDLVDPTNTNSMDAREKLYRWWGDIAEARLDPGGMMVLQGQRLAAEDLYRHALNLQAPADDDDDDEADEEPEIRMVPKYKHILFKAHYDDICTGRHRKGMAPYPESCLLDPVRLPYKDLMGIRYNNERRFRVVYQQEDADPGSVLVNPLWITGGKGPDGTDYPGCWDVDRRAGIIPQGLTGTKLSIVTADPSPTQFWSVQWWLYHPDSQQRFLIDHHRARMDAPDLLDWNENSRTFTGLLDEWWLWAKQQGAPFSKLIVENNAAQRFLLQYDHVRRWKSLRSVDVIGHETYRNKSDPKLGITTIAPHYQFGRVRLPGYPYDDSRLKSLKLVDEVTRWPESATDDCVMAHWFLEWNLPRIYSAPMEPIQSWRPSGYTPLAGSYLDTFRRSA